MAHPFTSYNLDHLGLVAGMIDELGLVSLIDTLIPQDHQQRKVSVGLGVKAMILNGLGFVNRALYLMPHFFQDKPVERLLGSGMLAEYFNDDVLGRILDRIADYGSTELYPPVAASTVHQLGLTCAIGHLDSSSVHVDGVYNSEQDTVEEGVLHITQGYSRDHRPDLNQIVIQLISEQQAGIPLWMTALSGNSNDKTAFRELITTHLNQLKTSVGLELIVADSALYTAKTLAQLGPFPWVTRVPETIGGVSDLCGSLAVRWMASRPERAVVPLCSTYGGIRQRWLVVYTRAAHERAEQTVNRSLLKQTQADYQAFNALSQQTFACEADANTALARFQKKQRVTELHETQLVPIKRFKGKGRPRKNQNPEIVGYRIEGHLASVIDRRQQQIAPKCCFILASNELDETRLSDDALIEAYTPGQQVVERGFRFLKDPWFMASTVFLKSPKRIEALMMIMTLCLLVYSALEYRIRQSLSTHNATFPAQQGAPTTKPTARWVFRFFAGIHVLVLSTLQTLVLNCNEHHQQLLQILGPRYVALYSDSS